MTRRSALLLTLAWPLPAAPKRRRVSFGAIADIHKDVMHDADSRLRAFLAAARKGKRDFVIQMGDFCQPQESNRAFLALWNADPGPRFHVLGNHDIDGGFSWQQAREYLGMTRSYYSFEMRGWHFIVLDGNEKNPGAARSGYPRYIGEEQLAWLADDLKRTAAPTIVFSHQSLEHNLGVENAPAVRAVLESANRLAGWPKVGACFSGHHHIDFARTLNGIHYVQLNSASYHWLGERYQHVRYSAEIDRQYPDIKYTVPYRDPLFAMITLRQGRIEIQGTQSEFVGPSPWELGMEDGGESYGRDVTTPRIRDRSLGLG